MFPHLFITVYLVNTLIFQYLKVIGGVAMCGGVLLVQNFDQSN